MLGKLFNLGPGSAAGTPASAQSPSQRAIAPLESVQEDIHTRNLLFPDAQALFQHRHDQVFPLSSTPPLASSSMTSPFDYNSDVDLETRDVRVIIMQDALGPFAASLLYDSQPPPVPGSPPDRPPATTAGPSHQNLQESRRSPMSPRKPSLTHGQRPAVPSPDGPQPRQGAFDRRPSLHARSHSLVESDSQRALREYREELTTFSSCIFGNSELMAYKGTSTKVHVVPSEQRPAEPAPSVIRDGRGSLGRSNIRASRLSQSFSSERAPPFNPPPMPTSAPRAPERKKVLVTRLFPVNLPADEDSADTPRSRFPDDSSAYPFPMTGEERAQPKQKRTPMYAVALVIDLPPGTPQGSSAALPRSIFRGPSSYTEQDSFPSSSSSTRRSGWAMTGQSATHGLDSFDSTFSSDMEDRIDAITQHWDIVMRTLTYLQTTVATIIFPMLKQVDAASPDPVSPLCRPPAQLTRAPATTGWRGEEAGPVNPPKSNAKHITLPPNGLMESRSIGAEVDHARARIVAGLGATRAVTGQNRWGIWREEARWVARWAAIKEQGTFFHSLLAGFLATHTDWLQALAPLSYRRRHSLQQRARDEDAPVPARTVIVAGDKMAARRLLFLLSAFLPANQQVHSLRVHRPSTSTSFGALSQSPPSYIVPIIREESLRRKINRRPTPRRVSHSRNVSVPGQARAAAVPPTLAHLSMEARHERRASDASSIRTMNLPIPGSDYALRKVSTTAAATISAETSTPHFSTAPRTEVLRHRRQGSRGSSAAEDLKRFARDNSGGPPGSDSRHSRWGSVISGLWSARRRGSTSTSADAADPPGPRSSHADPEGPARKASAKADAAPRPASGAQAEQGPACGRERDPAGGGEAAESGGPATPRQMAEGSQAGRSDRSGPPTKLERVPAPSGAFESPVKTSINMDDGVIDVDVPFPDYLASFETAVSSPSSSGILSTPTVGSGLDAFEQSSRTSADGDVPLNAAGWLQHYHPDFVLQAVPAQDGLVEQVRASLRAEPSPPLPPRSASGRPAAERWVDVGTAIIADTESFCIRRIRYRRLVRPRPAAERATPLTPSPAHAYGPAAVPAYEQPAEDEFVEERIAAVDEVLAEAVERVLAFGAEASKGSSAASSRSASNRRGRSNSGSSGSGDAPQQPRPPPHEVPRSQCKAVILSALEDIIREVVEARDEEPPARGAAGKRAARRKQGLLGAAVGTWLENVDLCD